MFLYKMEDVMNIKKLVMLSVLSMSASLLNAEIDPDQLINDAEKFGETVGKGIEEGFKDALNTVEDLGKGLLNDIKGAIGDIESQIQTGALEGIAKMEAGEKVFQLQLKQEFVATKVQLLGALKNAQATFANLGTKALDGIKNASVAIDKIKEISQDAIGGIKEAADKIKFGFTWLGDHVKEYADYAILMVKALLGKGPKPDYKDALTKAMQSVINCKLLPMFYDADQASKIANFTKDCPTSGDDAIKFEAKSPFGALSDDVRAYVLAVMVYNYGLSSVWTAFDKQVPSDKSFAKLLTWQDILNLVAPYKVTFTPELEANIKKALSSGTVMDQIAQAEWMQHVLSPVINNALKTTLVLPTPLPANLTQLFQQIDESFYLSTVAFGTITKLLANDAIRKNFTWDTFAPLLKPFNVKLSADQTSAIQKAFTTNTALPDFDINAAIEKQVYYNMIIQGLNSQLCAQPFDSTSCAAQSSLCPQGQCVTTDNVEQFPSTAFRFFYCFGYMFGKYYTWDFVKQNILPKYANYLTGGGFAPEAEQIIRKSFGATAAPADCALGT